MSIAAQIYLFDSCSKATAYGPFITRKEAMRQGLKFYYVGHLCKNSHLSIHRVSGGCFECARLSYEYKGIRSQHGKCPVKLAAKIKRRIERVKAFRQTPEGKRHRSAAECRRYARLTQEQRLPAALRARIHLAIKSGNGKKAAKSVELLGCTISQAKAHLEAQFRPGMNWDNHGRYGWHIDHIRPCASFDLTDPEQQRQCFHYTNLQPLWWDENIRKGAKVA